MEHKVRYLMNSGVFIFSTRTTIISLDIFVNPVERGTGGYLIKSILDSRIVSFLEPTGQEKRNINRAIRMNI